LLAGYVWLNISKSMLFDKIKTISLHYGAFYR